MTNKFTSWLQRDLEGKVKYRRRGGLPRGASYIRLWFLMLTFLVPHWIGRPLPINPILRLGYLLLLNIPIYVIYIVFHFIVLKKSYIVVNLKYIIKNFLSFSLFSFIIYILSFFWGLNI